MTAPAGPKTIEEAKALPEVRNLLADGYFLGAAPITGDMICAFVDDDGEAKRVECIRRTLSGPDEWVKVPA